MIIQYILYFICQKLYWTVSGQLSNIGYIGQFQNEATGTLRTRSPTHQSSVTVLNENTINISAFVENIDMFSHRLIFIMNNIFDIGWLTVQYRSYWTQISYIGLGCASSNIVFFVQYNLYWTVNHPILYNIYIYIYTCPIMITSVSHIFSQTSNFSAPVQSHARAAKQHELLKSRSPARRAPGSCGDL